VLAKRDRIVALGGSSSSPPDVVNDELLDVR
jgi:hypothetical protein